jgi:hypothetical protein
MMGPHAEVNPQQLPAADRGYIIIVSREDFASFSKVNYTFLSLT